MKVLVVIFAFWAITNAKPSTLPLSFVRTGFISLPYQSQFHAQDGFGQYAYGYADGLSTKEEFKSLDGTTRGSYSYVDAEGKLQSVDYAADAGGFRVAATNLPKAEPQPLVQAPQQPQPVVDTPEVVQAKAAHLAAIKEAKLQSGELSSFKFDPESLPKPVEDTPEVAKAKAEHLAAKKEVEVRNSIAQKGEIQAVRLAPVAVIPTLKYEPTRGFAYSVNAPAWNSRFLSTPLLF